MSAGSTSASKSQAPPPRVGIGIKVRQLLTGQHIITEVVVARATTLGRPWNARKERREPRRRNTRVYKQPARATTRGTPCGQGAPHCFAGVLPVF
jgi:hypothetical protein